MVRGELFKRYPNAIVYAGKATRDSKGMRVLDESSPDVDRYPLFRGTLPPDMTFIGFNLVCSAMRVAANARLRPTDTSSSSRSSPPSLASGWNPPPTTTPSPSGPISPGPISTPAAALPSCASTSPTARFQPSSAAAPGARLREFFLWFRPTRSCPISCCPPPRPPGLPITPGSDDAKMNWGVNSRADRLHSSSPSVPRTDSCGPDATYFLI